MRAPAVPQAHEPLGRLPRLDALPEPRAWSLPRDVQRVGVLERAAPLAGAPEQDEQQVVRQQPGAGQGRRQDELQAWPPRVVRQLDLYAEPRRPVWVRVPWKR